jgi:hypothetical protein
MELDEIIGKIRNFICIHRIKYDFIQNKMPLWQQLNSSLDAIQDTNNAVTSYINLKFPDDPGKKILCLYGLLQALYVQQDALDNLFISLNEHIDISAFPNIYKIRQIRNDAIGHPTKRNNKTYHFISSGLIAHRSFIYSSRDATGSFSTNEIDINDLITEQNNFLRQNIRKLYFTLTKKDQDYKDRFKMIKMRNIFSNSSYSFIKIAEGIAIRSSLALEMLKSLPSYLENFEKSLIDRGLSLDLYEIRYFYDEINYTLEKLLRYFNQEATDEEFNKLDAKIYFQFLESKFNELKTFAKEIDEDFESEY